MSLRVEVLEARHDRAGFACGEATLDRYFREHATQDMRRRVSNCFVAVRDDAVVGFYTIASASIPATDLPKEIAKRLPRYPVLPAIRIGRLAVDQKSQGQGVGGVLLVDAMLRALRAEISGFTLLVDAKNERAAAFYRHHGFMRLQDASNTLFLPLAIAEKLFPAG